MVCQKQDAVLRWLFSLILVAIDVFPLLRNSLADYLLLLVNIGNPFCEMFFTCVLADPVFNSGYYWMPREEYNNRASVCAASLVDS